MQYYHGDLIGSTMLTTDSNGDDVSSVTYSAFGEILDASGTPGGEAPTGFPRYQYAGEFGYESDLITLTGVNPDLPPITLQHLGWRWYQADIGRFVQRDPIGIWGGLNCYAYCANNPLIFIDSSGLDFMTGAIPIAAGAALIDGPVPVGDTIGACILAGAWVLDWGNNEGAYKE